MIYKNKELLMQVCNILRTEFHYYDDILYVKSMYNYLLNCGDEDWQSYYKCNIPKHIDRTIRKEYKKLIHSLNEFNRFKV